MCHRIVAAILVVASANLSAGASAPDPERIRRALHRRPSLVIVSPPPAALCTDISGASHYYRQRLAPTAHSPLHHYRQRVAPVSSTVRHQGHCIAPTGGSALHPRHSALHRPSTVQPAVQGAAPSDSVWEGLLIGAGIGAVGGYIWAREICGGTDDTECFLISAPVGILGGVGIGALVGAVADKLHK